MDLLLWHLKEHCQHVLTAWPAAFQMYKEPHDAEDGYSTGAIKHN